MATLNFPPGFLDRRKERLAMSDRDPVVEAMEPVSGLTVLHAVLETASITGSLRQNTLTLAARVAATLSANQVGVLIDFLTRTKVSALLEKDASARSEFDHILQHMLVRLNPSEASRALNPDQRLYLRTRLEGPITTTETVNLLIAILLIMKDVCSVATIPIARILLRETRNNEALERLGEAAREFLDAME